MSLLVLVIVIVVVLALAIWGVQTFAPGEKALKNLICLLFVALAIVAIFALAGLPAGGRKFFCG